MEVLTKMPVTKEERLEMGDELRIPATWDEFLDLLEEGCDYRVEYDNGEIISFMGYATKIHEKLVVKIATLLSTLLSEDLYSVQGSNLPLRLPGMAAERYYNADLAVVKGENEEVPLRGDMVATVNPILVVEVLSASTRDFDLGTKLRRYKKCPCLRQILFVESVEMQVLSYTRRNGGSEWSPRREFTLPQDKVPILNEGFLSLKEIYRGVNLPS